MSESAFRSMFEITLYVFDSLNLFKRSCFLWGVYLLSLCYTWGGVELQDFCLRARVAGSPAEGGGDPSVGFCGDKKSITSIFRIFSKVYANFTKRIHFSMFH